MVGPHPRVISMWHSMSVPVRVIVIAAAAIVVVVVIVVIATVNRKDDTPKYTLVEAACVMLRKGDTPDEARRALQLTPGAHVDDDQARLAVTLAVAQGC